MIFNIPRRPPDISAYTGTHLDALRHEQSITDARHMRQLMVAVLAPEALEGILTSTVCWWLQNGQSKTVGTLATTFFITLAYASHTMVIEVERVGELIHRRFVAQKERKRKEKGSDGPCSFACPSGKPAKRTNEKEDLFLLDMPTTLLPFFPLLLRQR